MHYGYTDYSAEEVRETLLFFEQFVMQERKYQKELSPILGILRAVAKINKGTEFLSEMSNTIPKVEIRNG